MITIKLDGVTVTIPEPESSARHYAGYTSAELMGLGVRTREAMDKHIGAANRAIQVQLYTVERELLRRDVVATYSELSREVSNLVFKAMLEKVAT